MIIEKWYKWLYMKIGGRPWTYILRDIYHKYEAVPICIFMIAGGGITALWGFKWVLISLGIFLIGYLAGHLFFGKDYIPGQGGD